MDKLDAIKASLDRLQRLSLASPRLRELLRFYRNAALKTVAVQAPLELKGVRMLHNDLNNYAQEINALLANLRELMRPDDERPQVHLGTPSVPHNASVNEGVSETQPEATPK